MGASPTTQPTGCTEDPADMFFLRYKNGDPTLPVFKSCQWLADSTNTERLCSKKTESHGTYGPPGEVCKATCGSCPTSSPTLAPTKAPTKSPTMHLPRHLRPVQLKVAIAAAPSSSMCAKTIRGARRVKRTARFATVFSCTTSQSNASQGLECAMATKMVVATLLLVLQKMDLNSACTAHHRT